MCVFGATPAMFGSQVPKRYGRGPVIRSVPMPPGFPVALREQSEAEHSMMDAGGGMVSALAKLAPLCCAYLSRPMRIISTAFLVIHSFVPNWRPAGTFLEHSGR